MKYASDRIKNNREIIMMNPMSFIYCSSFNDDTEVVLGAIKLKELKLVEYFHDKNYADYTDEFSDSDCSDCEIETSDNRFVIILDVSP